MDLSAASLRLRSTANPGHGGLLPPSRLRLDQSAGALSAATERTTALLKERRAALIAAAVTGQIEVGTAAACQPSPPG
ncbi:MAG TPA: hypothetical protein VN776_10740 [Terracidiphilus sp.]|nr:hypothetical protein [Terracidiphilus sp.]